MDAELRRTLALLALAWVTTSASACLTLQESAAYLAPRCTAAIESIAGDDPTSPPRRDARVIVLDQERDGVRLRLITATDLEGSVVSARMVRVGDDPEGRRCECGSVRLADQGVSSAGGDVRCEGDSCRYLDARWGVSPQRFRLVERPSRHFQRDRVFARPNLPALVSLLCLLALALVTLRGRKAAQYAIRLRHWIEARLDANGRVELPSGDIVGVLEGPLQSLDAGPVLVDPAMARPTAYRDAPTLARRHIARESHATWRDETLRTLRSASRLAVVSMACSAAAVIAAVLGR